MKKWIALMLALLMVLTVLAGCGENKPEEPEETAAPEGNGQDAGDDAAAGGDAQDAAPEETPDRSVTALKLGDEELQIRITDVSLDDEGKLTIVFEGITVKNSWRNLVVEVVLDGEKIFMEQAKANTDGYSRTSARQFEKLPEQVILYENGSDQEALVYDVANGVFEG